MNPCCGNLGGGGFLLLHTADGRSRFVNFREKAPGAASQDMYLDGAGNVVKGASLRGWKAAGVPGTVLGLTTALAHYGTLPLAKVVAPAVALARDGFVLNRGDTDILESGTEQVRPGPEHRPHLPAAGRHPVPPGDRLVQPDLAAPCRPSPTADRTPSTRARSGQGRGGLEGRRRDPDGQGFRRLHRHRGRPADMPLPGGDDPRGPAAVVRRHDAVRDPDDPRRLRPRRRGGSTPPAASTS